MGDIRSSHMILTCLWWRYAPLLISIGTRTC
jgi:hypothetical protein